MSTIKHSASFEIAQRIDVLFPLFSPEGEKAWIPGWDYINVMGSKDLHEDYVFMTKNNDHAFTDVIWIVKEYDPSKYRVQYYKVEPEKKVGIIEVKCLSQGNDITKVQVSYEYIGISEEGDQFVSEFTADNFHIFISEWEILLQKYFDTIAGS